MVAPIRRSPESARCSPHEPRRDSGTDQEKDEEATINALPIHVMVGSNKSAVFRLIIIQPIVARRTGCHNIQTAGKVIKNN